MPNHLLIAKSPATKLSGESSLSAPPERTSTAKQTADTPTAQELPQWSFARIPVYPPGAPVQMRGGRLGQSSQWIRSSASYGLSGSASPLPFMSTIQRAFGHHDISQVQAHTGSTAATGARLMGAEAFASGNQIAFGSTPTVQTAAHEAAHIVQQRHGVGPASGVGQIGDHWERQADAVAAQVTSGKSAEGLLDQAVQAGAAAAGSGGEGSSSRVVQRYIKVADKVYDFADEQFKDDPPGRIAAALNQLSITALPHFKAIMTSLHEENAVFKTPTKLGLAVRSKNTQIETAARNELVNELQEAWKNKTQDDLAVLLWENLFSEKERVSYEQGQGDQASEFGLKTFKTWVKTKYSDDLLKESWMDYPQIDPAGKTALGKKLSQVTRPMRVVLDDDKSFMFTPSKIQEAYRQHVWGLVTQSDDPKNKEIDESTPLKFSKVGQGLLTDYIDSLPKELGNEKPVPQQFKQFRHNMFMFDATKIAQNTILQFSGHFAPTHGGHARAFFGTFGSSAAKTAHIELKRNYILHGYDRDVPVLLWDLYLQEHGFTRSVVEDEEDLDLVYKGKLNGTDREVHILVEEQYGVVNGKNKKEPAQAIGIDVLLAPNEQESILAQTVLSYAKKSKQKVLVIPRDPTFKASFIKDSTKPDWLPRTLQKKLGKDSATKVATLMDALKPKDVQDKTHTSFDLGNQKKRNVFLAHLAEASAKIEAAVSARIPNYTPFAAPVQAKPKDEK